MVIDRVDTRVRPDETGENKVISAAEIPSRYI